MEVVASVLLALTLFASPDQDRKKSPAPSQRAQTELTGCIDERGEDYVLTSPSDMRVLARLKGQGFSDDNFARYIGRKVKVQGRSTGGVFEVVKITKLADSCSQ